MTYPALLCLLPLLRPSVEKGRPHVFVTGHSSWVGYLSSERLASKPTGGPISDAWLDNGKLYVADDNGAIIAVTKSLAFARVPRGSGLFPLRLTLEETSLVVEKGQFGTRLRISKAGVSKSETYAGWDVTAIAVDSKALLLIHRRNAFQVMEVDDRVAPRVFSLPASTHLVEICLSSTGDPLISAQQTGQTKASTVTHLYTISRGSLRKLRDLKGYWQVIDFSHDSVLGVDSPLGMFGGSLERVHGKSKTQFGENIEHAFPDWLSFYGPETRLHMFVGLLVTTLHTQDLSQHKEERLPCSFSVRAAKGNGKALITMDRFVKKGHRFTLRRPLPTYSNHVYIDGSRAWGLEGTDKIEYPNTQFTKIAFEVGGRKLALPRNAYRDTFDAHCGQLVDRGGPYYWLWVSEQKKLLRLKTWASDGTASFGVIWTLHFNGKYERQILFERY